MLDAFLLALLVFALPQVLIGHGANPLQACIITAFITALAYLELRTRNNNNDNKTE